MADVNETQALALDDYHRHKQELIDRIRHLSRMFFRTAMNGDVEELRERYNHLILLDSAHNKTIYFNSKPIARFEQNVHDIASFAAILRYFLNTVSLL